MFKNIWSRLSQLFLIMYLTHQKEMAMKNKKIGAVLMLCALLSVQVGEVMGNGEGTGVNPAPPPRGGPPAPLLGTGGNVPPAPPLNFKKIQENNIAQWDKDVITFADPSYDSQKVLEFANKLNEYKQKTPQEAVTMAAGIVQLIQTIKKTQKASTPSTSKPSVYVAPTTPEGWLAQFDFDMRSVLNQPKVTPGPASTIWKSLRDAQKWTDGTVEMEKGRDLAKEWKAKLDDLEQRIRALTTKDVMNEFLHDLTYNRNAEHPYPFAIDYEIEKEYLPAISRLQRKPIRENIEEAIKKLEEKLSGPPPTEKKPTSGSTPTSDQNPTPPPAVSEYQQKINDLVKDWKARLENIKKANEEFFKKPKNFTTANLTSLTSEIETFSNGFNSPDAMGKAQLKLESLVKLYETYIEDNKKKTVAEQISFNDYKNPPKPKS